MVISYDITCLLNFTIKILLFFSLHVNIVYNTIIMFSSDSEVIKFMNSIVEAVTCFITYVYMKVDFQN